MTERARELLEEALRLPADERAQIAERLLASVEDTSGPEIDSAWATETERRARRALRGEEVAEDWDVVRARLEAKYTR